MKKDDNVQGLTWYCRCSIAAHHSCNRWAPIPACPIARGKDNTKKDRRVQNIKKRRKNRKIAVYLTFTIHRIQGPVSKKSPLILALVLPLRPMVHVR